MPKHLIDNHPLDGVSIDLQIRAIIDGNHGMDDSEIRQLAEHKTACITESSSLSNCAEAFLWLANVHVEQINQMFHDINAGHNYSNPFELISKESEKKEHRKIEYTGNIAKTHKRIKKLDGEIVSEETPSEMKKTLFWGFLIGIIFLVLGILSVKTGAGVNTVMWLLDNPVAYMVLFVAIVGFSIYFGIMSGGLLIVGGLLIIGWLFTVMPWLMSVLVNGILFIVAGICLLVAFDYIGKLKNYRPLTEEEHEQNQALIDERDTLKKELKEYSELMLSKLDIMKNKFMSDSTVFMDEMQKIDKGTHTDRAVNEMFSFLRRYYKGITK